MAEKGEVADAGAPPPPGHYGQSEGPPMYGYAPAPGGAPPNAAETGYQPPPPGCAPPMQTSGYPMAGPGGYAPVPSQPVVVYAGFAGQPGYGPGPGLCTMPPGTYVQMQSAPSAVVTSQVMSMAPVQPVNNSLIISSMVLSIVACAFALCCFLSGLCAFPAVVLATIAICSGPAMSPAAAERKNSFARIAIALAVVALVTGAVIIICYLFIMVGSNGNASNSSRDLELAPTDGDSFSSMTYSSSVHYCKWQRDYINSSLALSCCCMYGYGSRADCYINGVSTKRAMCKKCGPLYSDYPY